MFNIHIYIYIYIYIYTYTYILNFILSKLHQTLDDNSMHCVQPYGQFQQFNIDFSFSETKRLY